MSEAAQCKQAILWDRCLRIGRHVIHTGCCYSWRRSRYGWSASNYPIYSNFKTGGTAAPL